MQTELEEAPLFKISLSLGWECSKTHKSQNSMKADNKLITFDKPPIESSFRTRNRFIFARSHLGSLVRPTGKSQISAVSKLISKIWKTDKSSFKNYYQYLAQIEEQCYASSNYSENFRLEESAPNKPSIPCPRRGGTRTFRVKKAVKKKTPVRWDMEVKIANCAGLITQDIFFKPASRKNNM